MSLLRVRVCAAGAALAALALAACAQRPILPPQATVALPADPSASAPVSPAPKSSGASTSAAEESPATDEPEPAPSSSAAVEPSPSPSLPEPILQEGDSGDQVRELQARLQQLKWYDGRVDGSYGGQTSAALRGFQAKRGLPETGYLDEITWDHLVENSREPTAEELAGTPVDTGQGMTLDPRCLTGRVLCASKSQRKLAWVIDGEIQVILDARFGRPSLPTSNGEFSVQWKSRDHWSKKYDAAMPYALFFNGGQAVHYSPEFASRGYSGGSHGCVNIRDKSAMRDLFDAVNVGDKVVVFPD